MRMQIIAAMILLLFTQNLFCETKEKDHKIPFLNYQNSLCPSSNKTSTQETYVAYTYISTNDIQNTISDIKNSICSSVGDADIKVWLSLDACGKVLGLGMSTQGGVEVTFHCKETKKK